MNSHRHKHTRSILSALLCFALWLNALPLWAAEVHGQVKFGGLPLPGATVSASQGDKNFVALADANGNYSIPDLADGAWTLKVEMLGFTPITQDLTVATNPPIPAPPADFELKMLSLDEIKAIAGPAATQAPSISYTAPPVEAPTNTAIPNPPAGKKQAAAKKGAATPAPANGQNSFQRTDVKANAAPPATNAVPNPETTAANSFNTQDTGELSQRANDGFLVNGSQNNGAASPFAQAGRFGNNVRGPNSLYQFQVGFIIDNSALDARTYSLTGQNTIKPQTNNFTVLGNFAGPIRIRHWFKQAPTVFVNYQFNRASAGTTTSALMPTADQIAGNFAASPAVIYDPTSGMPFGGNVIPANRISQQAQALLKFYPQPNFTTGISYNYQVPIVTLTQKNNVQARFNKSLTTKDQLSGQFGYQYQSNNNPNIFDFIDTGNGQGINVQLNEQHRYTPRTFGNLQVQFSRQSNRLNPFFANRQNVSGEAGITGNNQEPVNYGPPSLFFSSGINGLSDGNSSFTRNQTTGISYTTTWIHGRHNVQYGGDFRWQQFNSLAQANPRGNFGFTGGATSNILNNVAQPGTGNAFADFLLGVPDTSSISYGNADKYFRTKMVDAFANDDWRIGPSLTLNLGVRWDYGAPITEKYNRLVNLDVTPDFTAIAPVVANANLTGPLTGQKYPDSLVRPDWKEFQPILGFAWRPIPASSIVVRGGYSLRYNTSIYQQMATLMSQQSPLSTSLQVPNVFTNPPLNTLASGFNTLLGTTTNNFAVDPNFRVGYAQNWYTSIQKDLPGSLIMTVYYYGTKGTRIAQEFYPNTYPLGVTNPCASCPSGYIYETSNGNSTREAGQLQLRRRLHSGFTAQLQYTYAKAIDDSNAGGRGTSSLVAQNWLDLSAERGLSATDQRHLLNVTMQYTTGQGIAGGTLLSGWRGAIFKEWTVLSSVNAGTGMPLTPIYAATVPGTGFNGVRPIYTGADVYSNAQGQFLNPLAYAPPLNGAWGNAARNSITGPAQFTMNASFSRTFRLRDRYSLDVRIDSVNPINHVTFTSWNTTINNPQYGTAVSANAMRSLQTTLRLRF
jgi:Carboxypeptidase regulatory-like domain